MRRYDPIKSKCSDPSERVRTQNTQAVARILGALHDLDLIRAGLQEAADALLNTVTNSETPEAVRLDFQRFQRAGGCTVSQYQQWLYGQMPREPVLKRRHMRLVTSQKQVQRIALICRCLSNPDDTPPAA